MANTNIGSSAKQSIWLVNSLSTDKLHPLYAGPKERKKKKKVGARKYLPETALGTPILGGFFRPSNPPTPHTPQTHTHTHVPLGQDV